LLRPSERQRSRGRQVAAAASSVKPTAATPSNQFGSTATLAHEATAATQKSTAAMRRRVGVIAMNHAYPRWLPLTHDWLRPTGGRHTRHRDKAARSADSLGGRCARGRQWLLRSFRAVFGHGALLNAAVSAHGE
jgi:hypothetical protein